MLSSVTALPSPAVPFSPTKQGTVLRPIAIRDFEAAQGLQRRQGSEDFSDLSLQTQSQLIYGSPGGQDTLTSWENFLGTLADLKQPMASSFSQI